MRKAFSLVELLVTVGLLVLLVSLLLPALSRARQQALRAQCVSNQRQILAAFAGYEMDWEGALPWANWISIEMAGYRAPGWLYRYPNFTAQDDVQQGALFRYLKTAGVFHCPSHLPPYISGPTEALTSYLMNGATCAYGRHFPSYSMHRFASDAILFWEADPWNQSGTPWRDGSDFPYVGAATWHGKGTTVGCADGHVEWLALIEFDRQLAQRPGRLWCAPDSADGT